MTAVPESVRRGFENALRRARAPARLNSIVELNKSIKKVNTMRNKLNQLHKIIQIHHTPGRQERPRGHPQRTNNNASWNRYMQKYNTLYAEYLRARRDVTSRAQRFYRSIHMATYPGAFELIQLRKHVNNYKPLIAQKVIARRIERASFDPSTKLGKAMLARSHEKMYSPSTRKRRETAARRIQTAWRQTLKHLGTSA